MFRIAASTPEARTQLEAVWQAQGDIINNQLSFADHAIAFKRFQNAEDFATHYPFAPYQFQLLQKIFESIRKVGATGRHLAKGERSMLDAFQTAAMLNSDKGTDILVPLYDFYPSIESFLDSTVKRAIDQASDNPGLERFDLKLLRALFLIRYAEAVKGTIDNLATLCLDRIDADKLALKRDIEASLNRLERQNLVSRNGDLWFFLTNEERDVSQEIKSVEVSSTEIGRLVAEIIFDEILSGQTKVRHRDTKSDYEFNRFLDGSPFKQANHALTLEVLTPVGAEYELMNDAKCIGRSAEGQGKAICRIANDARVDLELRTYLQIEKYIGPKSDAATPALKRILLDRKEENRERRSRLVLQLTASMNGGDFFALGQKPAIKGQSPSLQIDELLNYLVTNTYSKLGYIKVRQPDPAAEIRAVLSSDSVGQTSIANLGEEGNPLAMAEMRQYLTVAASAGRVLLSDVVGRFEGAPWGWRPDLETVLLIARLFMAGEIKLVMEGNDLDPKAAIEPLTKPARFKQVSLLKRKTADAGSRAKARELHKDLFATLPPEDEDALVVMFRENLVQLKTSLDRAKSKAEQKHFPGLTEITSALATIDKQLAIRDPFEFISALLAAKNDWLDLVEDTHDVLSFYKTQSLVWSRMLEAMTGFADNHTELAKDIAAAAAMAELERNVVDLNIDERPKNFAFGDAGGRKIEIDNFSKIPGSPLAYWASNDLLTVFSKHRQIYETSISEGQNITANNERFLRYFWEINSSKIGVGNKWVFYSKGGSFRKWYGNIDFVIDWSQDARDEYRRNSSARIIPEKLWFREGVTWTLVTSSDRSFRLLPDVATFDKTGSSIFFESKSDLKKALLFLNSNVCEKLLDIFNSTVSLQVDDVRKLPFDPHTSDIPESNFDGLYLSAKRDWDAFESSWDFAEISFIVKKDQNKTLTKSWETWAEEKCLEIAKVKKLEEETNHYFISTYGLQNELSPSVPESRITLARADREKDCQRLISYAIGCMMGRYSLDEPGLIYAHAGNVGFDPSRYTRFAADADGILPITDEHWFDDDAPARVRDFLQVVWGPDTLAENMAWLAESLGGKASETPEETIRRYMADKFYKDHLQTYKKRPIYWLFSSGKQGAFQALVYLHRYNEGTLSRMRAEYVIPLTTKLAARLEMLEQDANAASSAAARTKIRKQIESLRKKQVELLSFDEKLRHHADMRISLDLDDGVKVNYGKFGDLLDSVKVVTGGANED